jgi:hypothetical protein
LELVRQEFCQHMSVLPEAASILFGGGFPRDEDTGERRAAQRAIYYVQRELERCADEVDRPARESHPRRYVVESAMDFLEKAQRAIEILRGELPPCCQEHLLPK